MSVTTADLARKLARDSDDARSRVPPDFKPWERAFLNETAADIGFEAEAPAFEVDFVATDAAAAAVDAPVDAPSGDDDVADVRGSLKFSPLARTAGLTPSVIDNIPGAAPEPAARVTAVAASADPAPVAPRAAAAPANDQTELSTSDLSRADSVRFERELVRDNQGRASADTGVIGNAMPSGYWAGKIIQEQARLEAQRKEKEDSEVKRQLYLIDRLREQNRELQNLIDQNSEKIRQTQLKVDAADEVKDLIAKGQYDPKNEAHRRKLKELGIDPDQSPEEIRRQLEDKQRVWNNYIAGLNAQNAQAQEKIDRNEKTIERAERGQAYEAQNGRFVDEQMEAAAVARERRTGQIVARDDPSDADREGMTNEVIRSNEKFREEAREAQLGGADNNTQELIERREDTQAARSVDDAVGDFFREYAQINNLSNEKEKYERMKTLFSGASDDVRAAAYADEDARNWLDEDLKFKEIEVAQQQTLQPLTAPQPSNG